MPRKGRRKKSRKRRALRKRTHRPHLRKFKLSVNYGVIYHDFLDGDLPIEDSPPRYRAERSLTRKQREPCTRGHTTVPMLAIYRRSETLQPSGVRGYLIPVIGCLSIFRPTIRNTAGLRRYFAYFRSATSRPFINNNTYLPPYLYHGRALEKKVNEVKYSLCLRAHVWFMRMRVHEYAIIIIA